MRTLKFKDALSLMREEQKAPILILIPFYSGIGLHAHGSMESRRNNLKQCLKSLQGQGDIIVGTSGKSDYNFVAGLPYDIKTMQIDCEPEYIPYALATIMQKNGSVYSHVLMLEADSVLNAMRLKDAAKYVKDDIALLPYRYSNEELEVPQGPKKHHKLVSGGWMITHDMFKKVHFTKSVPTPLKQITTFDIIEQCKIVKHPMFQVENLSNKKGEGK